MPQVCVTRRAVLLALAGAGGYASQRLHSQAAIPRVVDDPDMYSVYASLLPDQWLVRVAKATRLVIQAETAPGLGSCRPQGPPLVSDWKAVLDDFLLANTRPGRILAGQSLGMPYDVLTEVEAASFEPNGPRYPESGGGHLTVSVVGFDEARRRAMVWMGHFCGELCGAAGYHFLERREEGWREVALPGVATCSVIS